MLVVSPIGPDAAAYYFGGREPGVWAGKGAAILGLTGEVQRRPLTAVLRGCDPRGGAFLPAYKPARRRAGWDLILAAPKSLSLLAASGGSRADVIVGAHRAAVAGVVGHFEDGLLRVLRSGRTVPGRGLVAAAFGHATNAAGEPHVHTHLVVANLAPGPDGAWSHVGGDWWPVRQQLAAVYRLGLRHHAREAGLEVAWRLRDDGLADVAGVPRAAIRQASSRSRAAAADASAFQTAGWRQRAGIQRGATVATRPGPERGQPTGAIAPTLAGQGLPAPEPAIVGRPDLDQAVSSRLLLQRSHFRPSDVYVALAASCPDGLGAPDAARWVDAFCARAERIGSSRWTTVAARAADERLAAALAGARILAAPPGRSHLLAHAAYVEAAADRWAAEGRQVRLVSDSPQGDLRWRVLTGLASNSGGRPDVLLVDHADRRSTPELLGIVGGSARAGSDVVLIEGGTLARLSWVCSDGLVRVGDSKGRVDPGPEPSWSAASDRAGRGAEAASRLLGAFADAWGSREAALLVGLGPAETDGLNRAARAHLIERGLIDGPAVHHRGRPLQAGDQVVALRRVAAGVASGSLRSVVEVEAGGEVRVTRPSGRGPVETIDRGAAAHLGYGYALTPALAARVDAPLLVLGPADALGRVRDRVRAAEMARDDLSPAREGPILGR